MKWNTILLIFDLLICIPIGYVLQKMETKTVKRVSALMLAIPAIPMFHFMTGASLPYVLCVRVWIVFWGVVFSSVIMIWWLRLFPLRSKYLWIGVGYAVGTSLIGRSTSALCLWGWHVTHLSMIPGLYLAIVAMLVLLIGSILDETSE